MPAPPTKRVAINWSGNGRWLAVHDHPGVIRLLERRDEQSAHEELVVRVDMPIDAVALSHDAQWLAAGGAGQVVLWRIDPVHGRSRIDEVSRGKLPGPDDARIELAFAPNALSLAVAYGTQLLLLRLDLEALRPKVLRDGWNDWALLITLSTRWSEPMDLTWGRDARALADWLRAPEAGGLRAERVLLLQHDTGGWHTLKKQLAAVLDAQDENPSRRLYLILACASMKIRGELHLVFGGEKDDVSSTPFGFFEQYLLEQIDRQRFSEIVFVVDTVGAKLEFSAQELHQTQKGPFMRTPPSTGHYLRLLNHLVRTPGNSLIGRVLAGLSGDAVHEFAGVVTSSSLVNYLRTSSLSEHQQFEARSTGDFALTTSTNRRVG